MLISIITTLFCGEVSRTQMYLSDSIVTFVKVMNCGLIPILGNVRDSFMVIGALAAAMVAGSNLQKSDLQGSFDVIINKGGRERGLNCGLRNDSESEHIGRD
jgi:hypothetical protein